MGSSSKTGVLNSVYVGVDPSISNTGVVLLNPDGTLNAAFNGRDAYTDPNLPQGVPRYVVQTEYLREQIQSKNVHVRAVCYEDYSFGSIHRTYSLAEFGGILKAMLLKFVPQGIIYVAPMANKKFATGIGNSDKEAVVNQAYTECPELKKYETNDVCDAWSLARFAMYLEKPLDMIKIDQGNKLLRVRLETVKTMRDKHGEEKCQRMFN